MRRPSGKTRGRRLVRFGTAMSAIAVVACNGAQTDPVARMIEALGGEPAIARLASLRVEADCTGPSGDFRTTVHSVRPDSVVFRQESPRGSSVVGSGPDTTWAVQNGEPVQVDAAARAFARGHEFHLLVFEATSRFSGHTVAGEEDVDGHACTRVTMTDEHGRPAALLIDRKTALPRGLELNPAGARGAVVIRFDDWREIDGLQYFGSFTLTEGKNRAFTYRYVDIVPVTHDP